MPRDLEMVHWVDEEDSMRGRAKAQGEPIERPYETFDEVRAAILEKGPIVIAGPKADLMFLVVGGRFEGQIMAVRQSGINVRRFLVREDAFESTFGDFKGCIDHLLSNNTVESEIELAHLCDVFEAHELDIDNIDPERDYTRLEVDLVAAMQMIRLKDEQFGDGEASNWLFDLGYSVGRLFSSAQNLATLEAKALKAAAYAQSYKERGRKGRSSERRRDRVEHLLEKLENLVGQNRAMSRMPPGQVAALALQDAVDERPELWSQGQGQLENYLTELASEPDYRPRFNAMFFETG